MKDNDNSKIDQLLDLLLDALQERQAARGGEKPDNPTPQIEEKPLPKPRPTLTYKTIPQDKLDEIESRTAEKERPLPEPPPMPSYTAVPQGKPDELQRRTAEETLIPSPYIPEKLPTINLDRMLGRLALFIFALIVAVNIPFNRYGTNLARAMPDEQSLVIRDGLVLKGSGDEIYVLEDNHRRWISSLDAFEYYGYRWEQVNIVDDAFLNRFPSGPALSVLQKCQDSPHIFAIENGVKRWIKDIPTFEAQGYVWEDVQVVSCTALRQIPTGSPIPPDAGESPIP
jgi:hypothetical protein